MRPFPGVDFMNFDSFLSEEELLVRKSVREFVDREIVPYAEGWYHEGAFPREIVSRMAELGYFGANLEGYGCAGMNNVAYGLLMQELERGDSAFRSFASVQSALVMWPIYAFGSEEQKAHWLPRLQRGEAIGCFGLTEPDFGSNPAGMRTRAGRETSLARAALPTSIPSSATWRTSNQFPPTKERAIFTRSSLAKELPASRHSNRPQKSYNSSRGLAWGRFFDGSLTKR